MQASFDIIVRNGFSMNFSIRDSSTWWSRTRMVRVTALDIQVNLRNPTAMLKDSMMSVNTLYRSDLILTENKNGELSGYVCLPSLL